MLPREKLIKAAQAQVAQPSSLATLSVYAPSSFVESSYYALLVYSMFGSAFGLGLDLLGAAILSALAVYCVIRLASQAVAIYSSISMPVACGIVYLLVQILWHGEALTGEYTKPFVTWIPTLIIIHALSFRRGFLHRFALIMFVIGAVVLPYTQIRTSDVDRLALRSTAVSGELTNPNGLAAWFGFCCVYFTILAVETRRTTVRLVSWTAAVGCLSIVGLTVSRGALIAVGVAIAISLRRLLKRGFVPLLLVMLAAWTLFLFGVFERATTSYILRGTTETGRLLVWPLAVQRFLGSPILGVGASKVATRVPEGVVSPHNSFIFIALASGIVPLLFFVAYWMRASVGARRASAERLTDCQFYIPLLTYAFLIALAGNLPFMSPWIVATLGIPIAAEASRQVRRATARREQGRRWSSKRTVIAHAN